MDHLLSWEEYQEKRKDKVGIFDVEGDLLDVDEGIIAHQTNCIGVMGAGLARGVKAKYTAVYAEYREHCLIHEAHELLGTTQVIETKEGVHVANLFGQNTVGRGSRQTDYGALLNSLLELREYAEEENLDVALPFELGCGLAGGDWSIVRELIQIAFRDFGRTVAIIHLQ